MTFSKSTLLSVLIVTFIAYGCADEVLKPELRSTTAPDNVFNSVQGIESVLMGAYGNLALNYSNNAAFTLAQQEFMTDISLQNGGGIESTLNPIQNFTITPSDNIFPGFWRRRYKAIRNANVILEEIDNAPINDDDKALIKAEARFIRAASYYRLYLDYGPVPLRTSTEQKLELARPSEQEMEKFIESEFIAAIPDLPVPGNEKSYGRAHKAAAIGYLTKFYLNTKQWQKSADGAKEIIDMQYFELYPDYFSMFFEANEGNKEMIWVRTATAPTLRRDAAMSIMNFVYPSNFRENPRTGLTFCSSCRNFPAQWRLYDSFYNSFNSGDERKSLIIREFVNAAGDTLSLLNNNDTRPFKYWPDQGANGAAYGNDIPVIRYADILLSRAEALNELNGPNQESIDLINDVRERADISDLRLADFGSKAELRDQILQERGWELWWEGKRRDDLIRQGKLVDKAHDRGITNAQDYHVRFPIPQVIMDANPALKQNPGY